MVRTFVRAIIGGMLISVGGIAFLSVENTVVGAFLFSIGLFSICFYQYNLYTGKVSYLPNRKRNYLSDLGVIWLGNLLGTFISGTLMNLTRSIIFERAQKICAIKLNDTMLSIFILSFFCGILMYIAVETYKRGSVIGVFMCVTVFILCGFEHCVANMFYFTVAGVWSAKTLLYIIIMTLGNSVGGILLVLLDNVGKEA